MGHIYEGYYDTTSRNEYATQAIEYYKKAYALDPKSPVIGERLAEIYFKSQRIREAVQEAQDILKREPSNLPARRLLAHIYVRTIGDSPSTPGQRDMAARAIEQFREILRLDATDEDASLWLARLYRLQGDTEIAVQALRDLLQRQPEDETAIEQLTQLLLDAGRGAEAISYLKGIIQRSPTGALLDALGDAYSQTHDYAKAEDAYNRAIQMDPTDTDHRKGLAQALMAQDKSEQAAEQYKRLTELDPDEPENFLRLAQIYRQLNQLDLAEENLLHAKQLAPGNVEVIYNEATIYEAQGRFEDAIRVLSDAVSGIKRQTEPAPGNRRTLAILYEQLGRIYREKENYAAAILTFQEMAGLGQEEARRARMFIIDAYRGARDMPKALAEVQKAIQAYPGDRGFRITHALLLGENGSTDDAAKELKAMLTGSSMADDREINLDLAQIYERGKRFTDAESAAHSAERLSLRPADNEMTWFMLGAIYERQKKFDDAEKQFQKVLDLNPHNGPALNYYGYMLADLGTRLDEATSLVKRALAEEPNNGAYHDSLGWAYFKQNRLTEAEKSLRKAVELDSHDPMIRDHLGDVYFKTGKNELAAAEWDRSLAEWRKALPTETEQDKIAALEKKLSAVHQLLAQQKPPGETKRQEQK
jgi:tetratricopeptide (TPR) repeat protein